MLQTYKKKVEAELEKCEKVSENLVHNYITDTKELEEEGEKKYQIRRCAISC